MSQALIIAAAKATDGTGSLDSVRGLEKQLFQLGITPKKLTIEPLKNGWTAPRQADHFRSGCAPIEALARARQLIAEGQNAVIIRGKDLIKSDYSRDERLNLMAIYGDAYPLTQAYDDLAHRFIQNQQADAPLFKEIAARLFENYQCTYRNVLSDSEHSATPQARWFNPITSLFRGVDCANPIIDFTGEVLICNPEVADQLQVPQRQRVAIRGVGLGLLDQDGPDEIETIAEYKHLRHAYEQCCDQADINFQQRFTQGNALLEAYTCYPVVPMAFLLMSGMVSLLEEIPDFLSKHAITVTGGMNLARGPWNNPALNGLISMYQEVTQGEIPLGAVHGNGGLGYRQGVALLERVS